MLSMYKACDSIPRTSLMGVVAEILKMAIFSDRILDSMHRVWVQTLFRKSKGRRGCERAGQGEGEKRREGMGREGKERGKRVIVFYPVISNFCLF